MEKEFMVNLRIIIEASIKTMGINEFKALESLIEKLNTELVKMNSSFRLETINGGIHILNAHDVEIDYVGIEEVYNESFKNKNTA